MVPKPKWFRSRNGSEAEMVPQPKCVVQCASQLDKVDTNDQISTLFLALRVPDGERRWVHSLSGIDQRS